MPPRAPPGCGSASRCSSRRCTIRCNSRRRSPPSTDSATAGSISASRQAAASASSRRSAWSDPRSSVASPRGLQLMTAAWSDEPSVTFHGRFRDVDALPIAPKPVQRPHPPIWFGANAPKAIARAVRLGDAFMGAGSSTTASFVDAAKIVRPRTPDAGKGSGGVHHRQADLSDGRRRCRTRPRTGTGGPAPHLRQHARHRCRSRVRHTCRRRPGCARGHSTPVPIWCC